MQHLIIRMQHGVIMSQNSSAIDPYASPSEVPVCGDTPRKRFFARATTIATAFCIGLPILLLQPFVGVSYLQYYDNEPLQNPVRTVRSTANEIELADGRRVIDAYLRSEKLDWALKNTDKNIEILPSAADPNRVEIYCKEFNFICGVGGPWYTIPLVPNRTKSYRRVLIGDGTMARPTELADQ